MKYPDDIEAWLTNNIKGSIILETEAALKEAGSAKALNMVMLGALSMFLEFQEEKWKNALRSIVKEKLIDLSLKAFEIGRTLITVRSLEWETWARRKLPAPGKTIPRRFDGASLRSVTR